MEKPDRPKEEKHVTKSTTSEPQEEFIAKARPSRPEESTPNEKQN